MHFPNTLFEGVIFKQEEMAVVSADLKIDTEQKSNIFKKGI